MTFSEYISNYEKEYEESGMIWFKSKLNIFYQKLKKNEEEYQTGFEGNYNNASNISNLYKNYIAKQKEIVDKEDIGALFVELSNLENNLSKYAAISLLLDKELSINTNKIQSINSHFNALFRNPSEFKNIKKFMNTMDSFQKSFEKMRFHLQTSKAIEKKLNNNIKRNENSAEIVLSFYDENDSFGNFLYEQNLFNEIYNEISNLFDLCSSSDNSLKVIKVESGSKFLNLLGNKHILDFLKYLIEKITTAIYLNFTTSGKIQKINGNLEFLEEEYNLLEKLVDLNNKLPSENQIDIELSRDNIEKSLVLITKRTQQLISKQTKIKIDDEIISLDDSKKEQYLEESSRILIGD